MAYGAETGVGLENLLTRRCGKTSGFFVRIIGAMLLVLPLGALASVGPWRGVALTPRLVAFTCEQTSEKTERPVVAKVRDFRARERAYWVRPIGASRQDTKGHFDITHAADVEHQVWRRTNTPMTNGETRVFLLPDDRRVTFTYDAAAPSPLFRINQLGYAPEAGEKYAYLGEWMGLAGGWEFPGGEEKIPDFSLIDEKTGAAVFTGRPKLRLADGQMRDGTPWTGERPYELDFSRFSEPGCYHLAIDGIGRSDSFIIGTESLTNAFKVHMLGMARQRCGVVCHREVYRGDFPPNYGHYSPDKTGERKCGFFNRSGESINVDRFRLIYDNVDRWKRNGTIAVPGGWHDAADYDRRPLHLFSVGDFAALALLKPACTSAVEEAYWGLGHLLAAQQADGGVGSWIETISHPSPGQGPTTEPKRMEYFLSCATRESTLEYCAYAAMTALAIKDGDPRRQRLIDSALRAWEYVHSHPPVVKDLFYAGEMVVYKEEPELPADMLLKAGLDLSELLHDDHYLEPVLADLPRVVAAVKNFRWWWSPLRFIELDIFERRLDRELRPCYEAWKSKVLQDADAMLDQLENAWPYRTPWYGPNNAHAVNIGWGFGLPLTRARYLITAHAITWRQKYLDGAYLANDFHNGCNPEGETYTSGLGIRPTKRYLDLEGKYPPGITPYRLAGSLEWRWIHLSHPDDLWKRWPFWRRYHLLESMCVKCSEFTVWETIAPAAVVTGYLAW